MEFTTDCCAVVYTADRISLDHYVDMFDVIADQMASAFIKCSDELHFLHPSFIGE